MRQTAHADTRILTSCSAGVGIGRSMNASGSVSNDPGRSTTQAHMKTLAYPSLVRGAMARAMLERLHAVFPAVLDDEHAVALAERRNNNGGKPEHGGFIRGAVPDNESPRVGGQGVDHAMQR